jgi:hypothetical protein
MINGGAQQAKIDAESAVIRTAFSLITQGKNVRYIGLEVYKRGESKTLTEIDILTENEMIEVKTGNYLRERKLSGRDMDQFTDQKRFFERKTVVVDVTGTVILPPARFVYQFTQPISPDLRTWLLGKGVTEVRAP